jgi:hypothetical protein
MERLNWTMVPETFILHSNITLFTGIEMSFALNVPQFQFRTEFFAKPASAPRSRPAAIEKSIIAVAQPTTTAAEERGQSNDSRANVVSRNNWLLWTI